MKKVAYIVIGLMIAGVLAAVFIPMIAKGPPYPGLETKVGMLIPLFLFLAGIYVLIRVVQFFIGMRRGYRKEHQMNRLKEDKKGYTLKAEPGRVHISGKKATLVYKHYKNHPRKFVKHILIIVSISIIGGLLGGIIGTIVGLILSIICLLKMDPPKETIIEKS